MSALAADVSFDFPYPYASVEDYPSTPSPPPTMSFNLDPSLLDMGMTADFNQYFTPNQLPRRTGGNGHGHARSSSRGSVYSVVSTVDSAADSVCTRLTTPPRASPPVRHHGPILLPKIRSQDQDIDAAAMGLPIQSVMPRRVKATPPPAVVSAPSSTKSLRVPSSSSHQRSYTNPESLNNMAFAHMAFSNACAGATPAQPDQDQFANSLLCSPASFAHDATSAMAQVQQQHQRRSSSVDVATIEKYGYPTYRQMPFVQQQQAQPQPDFTFPSATYTPRAPSPLNVAASAHATPEPSVASTTLMAYLTSANPAASLVRTISFPHRDPTIKHFWWDIRNVRSWTGFTARAVLDLPGAAALLSTAIPAPVVPQPSMSARHPETEAALHSIYASYYLPKINAALAVSSSRPLQLSVPRSHGSRTIAGAGAGASSSASDLIFTANIAGESATAVAMFGGKPTARVVGLVRTFDRFNTGMRAEGNIKRVEYLRGLAALHYAMREHGCRYGFILTEIELVLVRNGTESTPFFGDLEITSVHLATTGNGDADETPLTACLALWGLCQLASSDGPQPGHPGWKSEIGAPAEGTRRKAQPRDKWMPAPQLAEKREAKRSRGWVFPEDAVGRKELGKRGVRY